MCCLRLHYFYFNVLFVQKKLKTCCGLLLKKITCCAKREKKLNCREEKSQPPWISNGPSLTHLHAQQNMCLTKHILCGTSRYIHRGIHGCALCLF